MARNVSPLMAQVPCNCHLEETLPSSWAQRDFRSVFECVSTNAKSVKQRDYLPSGSIPVVDQGEGLIGGYTDDPNSEIAIERPVIVFGDHTRKFKFVNHNFAPGADGIKVIRPSLALLPKFAYYACLALKLPNRGYARHFGVLVKQRLPIAPFNEQRRIVDRIDTLFAQIDQGEAALRQAQKLLDHYRQSILQAAVTGTLTADWRARQGSNFEHGHDLLGRVLQARRNGWRGRGKYQEPTAADAINLPGLPAGWVWASVVQMVQLFKNGLAKKPNVAKSDLPVLRISAVRPMGISLADLRYYSPTDSHACDGFWVEREDLLFTRYNGSANFVGVCGQMRANCRVVHPDKLIRARIVSGCGLSTDYLEIAWNAGHTRKHIAQHIKTTSGQQGIAGADIKSAPFALPPPQEQVEIAARVWNAFEQLRTLRELCRNERQRCATLRQSILNEAFAGRLVAQNPNDESAAELLARTRSITQKSRDLAP